jgi:hypothetical protein
MCVVLYVNGAPDTIRTCDLCLRRATLYPAELRAQGRDGHTAYIADPAARGNRPAGSETVWPASDAPQSWHFTQKIRSFRGNYLKKSGDVRL